VAGLVTQALIAGGAGIALLSFLIASLTVGGLMFLVGSIFALARDQLVSRIRDVTGVIKHLAGYMLLIAGVWLMILGLAPNIISAFLIP
jgi:hypothetical protein